MEPTLSLHGGGVRIHRTEAAEKGFPMMRHFTQCEAQLESFPAAPSPGGHRHHASPCPVFQPNHLMGIHSVSRLSVQPK